VSADNLTGGENQASPMMMSNFNQERIVLSCAALRLSRVCAEDAYNFSMNRETFGKKLIALELIRSRVTQFGIEIEPTFSLLSQSGLVQTLG